MAKEFSNLLCRSWTRRNLVLQSILSFGSQSMPVCRIRAPARGARFDIAPGPRSQLKR